MAFALWYLNVTLCLVLCCVMLLYDMKYFITQISTKLIDTIYFVCYLLKHDLANIYLAYNCLCVSLCECGWHDWLVACTIYCLKYENKAAFVCIILNTEATADGYFSFFFFFAIFPNYVIDECCVQLHFQAIIFNNKHLFFCTELDRILLQKNNFLRRFS